MKNPARVSVHGGHSGQFCHHASGSLESIVKAYINMEYSWVGITEHAPAINEDLRYPDEKKAGLTSKFLHRQFAEYNVECRYLQTKYKNEITLYVGMEIETYSGYEQFVEGLITDFRPDYIVGSVHFVDDIPFDYSPKQYDRAVSAAGGVEALYCKYFDQQYSMLQCVRPAVVGHFDLVRLFDADYITRLQHPDIISRVKRNLLFIKKNGLILDYNLRALEKGASEPYVSRPILELACDLGIAVVPGDDSHGIDSVGLYIDEATAALALAGFDTNWAKPKLY